MKPGAVFLAAATAGVVCIAAARADGYPATMPRAQSADTFPHLLHQGLFPLCSGCHLGVATGDTSAFYPDPQTCNGCHDGQGLRQVDWTPPVPGAAPSLLRFTHPAHIQAVQSAGDQPLECATCHVPPGRPSMGVAALQPERCLSCHGHPAEQHVVDAPCATCHVPLASSDLPVQEIASFQEPPDHQGERFLAGGHGRLVRSQSERCATCHTRERCLTCHVDVNRRALQSIPEARPGLELPPAEAHYPTPASHQSADFERQHGVLAQRQSCNTCHTRDDCASCHLPPLPAPAAALPERGSVRAPGVGLMQEAPATHGSPFFMEDHSSLAASDGADCATCHTTAFCTECHDAPQKPSFHPPDYVQAHQADAWNQTAECANCHDTAAFCRSCHVASGFESVGKLGPGYHDAEPVWLLRHGQAARQSLESCASCHTQKDCLQCHSTVAAFQVNPHRAGWDARRAFDRNPGICIACHVTSPFGGGQP